MQHQPTDEQSAILDFVRRGDGHLIVEALAGSGKSWTLLRALEVIPQTSILMVAFNKGIADNLLANLPKLPKTHGVHVKTFHAQGLAVLKRHYPKVEVSKDATEQLINYVAGKSAISFKMRRAAVRLLRIVKETIATPTPPASGALLALGYEYRVFTPKMSERECSLTVEAVRDAYIVSLALDKRQVIDFCDMVWAPVALDLAPPSRYQAVIVDELQDVSDPQLQLLMRMLAPGRGRFIGVGDRHQQIYGWRGSLGGAVWSMLEEKLKPKILPLTMTFRCSAAVVKEANRIVPALRAAPDALPGSVDHCTLGMLPDRLANSRSDHVHTYILSRDNASLVDAALYLWKERVAFHLNTGKELLAPIFDLLQKLDTTDEPRFRRSLSQWFAEESARAEKANATAYQETIEEQQRMLLATLKYAKPSEIARMLNAILVPNQSGILCSTAHKVKGLEAERVYLLKQTFASFQERLWRLGDEWVTVVGSTDPEELNIEYVAITRAKEHVIYVDIESPEARERPKFELHADLDAMSIEDLFERLQRVERMATTTDDRPLADALMKHAREVEQAIEARG